ncbi:MAG: Abi family protein [Bacteroidales bacterium]|nr:Abi family protein [Bacteroidales bacterium]
MGTVAFTKTYLNPAQHIALLKSRGLQITNENLATAYLTNDGYYRLSAYFYPLLEIPKENHIYKPTATFDKVVSMYTFDSRLRALLFRKIEKIEVAIRSCVSHIFSSSYRSSTLMD